MNWSDALAVARARGEAHVLVTIEAIEGSAPRGVGARLVVTEGGTFDTIGGGALESAALQRASALLRADSPEPVVERETWTLGRALSQCCGGRAALSFAWTPASDFRLEVFGAGHVAQEIARLARRLPCIATFHDPRIDWLSRLSPDAMLALPAPPSPYVVASRVGGLPDIDLGAVPIDASGPGRLIGAPLGANVHAAIERCRPGAHVLVMTHSHELDLEVCDAALSRDDLGMIGLIASRSKARSFRSRLARKGFDADEIARLVAPLGEGVQTGNTPMEIAIAAMADVLTARERRRQAARAAPRSASDTAGPVDPDDADDDATRVPRARA